MDMLVVCEITCGRDPQPTVGAGVPNTEICLLDSKKSVPGDISLPDWKLSPSVLALEMTTDPERSTRKVVYDEVHFEITATRLPGYYVYNIAMVLLSIVSLSWLSFVFEPADVSSRFATNLTLLYVRVHVRAYHQSVLPL